MGMSKESAYTLVFQSLVIESLQIVFYIEHVAVGYEKVAGFCFKDHISVVRKISVAVAFDCKHRDPGSLSYFIRLFEIIAAVYYGVWRKLFLQFFEYVPEP